MGKIRVAVLMGGKTPEYDVSLATGQQVVANLDKKKYEVLPIVISRDGQRWQVIPQGKLLEISANIKSLPDQIAKKKSPVLSSSASKDQAVLKEGRVDVVFIAMHGPYGEDGTVQGLLELLGIPYTCSGVLASSLGMDKIAFRKILKSEGIPYPRFLVFKKGDQPKKVWQFFKHLPLFIKPYNQGSSVGASIVHQKEELKGALKKALAYSNPVIVEEYLKGIEISCAVLGHENLMALPLAEIIPRNEFFDYEAKYTPGKAEEIVPARISNNLTKKLQAMAVKAFRSIGASGVARVEFIVINQRPFVLEINTIPGLTTGSIVPKEAKGAGISYPQLLDKLIDLALKKIC